MIRVLQKADIERVVDIWLDTNLKAHYFIPGQYWKNNIDLVKEMLPQAEVYVYENDCADSITYVTGVIQQCVKMPQSETTNAV